MRTEGKREKIVVNDFSQGEIGRCITSMAIPMTLAELVNVLYSVVDRMYIGHMEGMGTLALTGLGISMPIICIITAFSMLLGTGGAPLCSIARGRGDMQEAERLMGNSFHLLVAFAIVLTVGLQIFLKPILYAFGASDATFPYALEYTRVYICGTVFMMISHGMNYFINAQGFARTGMLTVSIGAVLNIILDPILIFGCHMGIMGAAVATVFSQFCSALWVMAFLLGKKAILHLRREFLILDGPTIKRILGLGVTGFTMGMTNGLVQILYNAQLKRYGGDLYIGSMTVINSIREIVFMVVHGITDGAKPVLGYNYGAGLYERLKKGIRFVATTCVSYATIVWAVIMLIPGVLTRIFNGDTELLQVCVPAMRTFFCCFPFMSLMMSGQCVFVALGKAKHAVTFSLLRKVFFVGILTLTLPLIPGLRAAGVFWSEPVSDILGGGACFITMYFTVYRKLADKGPGSPTAGI